MYFAVYLFVRTNANSYDQSSIVIYMCIVGLGFAGRSCPIMQDTLQTAENDNPNAVQVLAMEGAQHGWITAWGMLCQR